MNFDKHSLRLYAVTDRAWVGRQTLCQQVEAALQGGVTCVQLREKHLGRDAFLAEAKQICALCRRYGVPFIVNDDLDVALACGAAGIHVGQDDMPAAEVRRRAGRRLIVGVSAHTPEEARLAEAAGADYLGAGAVFGSATKTDASLLTPAGLQAVCAAVHIPVVAIGGVNAGNILQLQGSGAAGAAVVSGIFGAPDITAACRELRALADTMVQGGPPCRKEHL